MKQAVILLLLTLFGVTACNTEGDPQPGNCRVVSQSSYVGGTNPGGQYYTMYKDGSYEYTTSELIPGDTYCD